MATKKLTGRITRAKAADLADCYGTYLEAVKACVLRDPPTIDDFSAAATRAKALIVAQKSAGIQLCKLAGLHFVITGATGQIRRIRAEQAKQEAIEAEAKEAAERAESQRLQDMFAAAKIAHHQAEAALTPMRPTTWDRIETPINKTAALGISHRKTET